MKLRNKKTGEIVEISGVGLVWNRYGMPLDLGRYHSITELNEEWEDYKPAEPLIKDEKIRKAVRAWADYNGVKEVFCFINEDGSSRLASCNFEISFFNEISELKDWKRYTIAELCGEED